MTTTIAALNKPLSETYATFFDAVVEIANTERELGMKGTEGTVRHVKSRFGRALLDSGAAIRTSSGAWLAHREHFSVALRALILGLPVPPLDTPIACGPTRARVDQDARELTGAMN